MQCLLVYELSGCWLTIDHVCYEEYSMVAQSMSGLKEIKEYSMSTTCPFLYENGFNTPHSLLNKDGPLALRSLGFE